MVWTPTCEFRGQEGFEQFYRCLTGNLFDRVHEVSDIKIESSRRRLRPSPSRST